ncbi:TipAS antibiotic-recognition domain-containing protein [Nocardia australiensis]|uniref:TipAS antibiotic-recognition domain-containing protein n=1 Tax=Nocardia australiensis TaxID=2887191 RepID=UPI001D136846
MAARLRVTHPPCPRPLTNNWTAARGLRDEVAEHYESVRRYWQPTPEAYAALGRMYLTDPQQRWMVDQVEPDLSAWLAAAIPAYARNRLGLHEPPASRPT